MLFLMALYAWDSLTVIHLKTQSQLSWKYHKMLALTLMFHLTAYATIFINTKNTGVLVFYGLQLLFFVLYHVVYRRLYPRSSRLFLNHTTMLLAVGFAVLTRLSDADQLLDITTALGNRAVKQFVLVCGAAAVTLFVPKFIEKLRIKKRTAEILGVGGLLMLVLVALLGKTTYGANLSFDFKVFTLQPSEFVKLTFVILTAMLLQVKTDFKRVCFATAVAGSHVIILVVSNDLGSALIYFLTYLVILYVATHQPLYLFAGLGCGSAAAVAAYFLFSHVRVRVAAWLDPWSLIDKDGGYQITQGLFAIGSGGWLGSGLYQGMPTKIPVVSKDYIFAAISEEFGGLFGVCLILVCLSLILYIFRMATKVGESFYKLIAVGFAALYGVQVLLTVGGVTKWIPLTGVTLPFVSYGGSSILSTFLMIAVLQGIYILKRNEDEEIERKRKERKLRGNRAAAGTAGSGRSRKTGEKAGQKETKQRN